MTLKGLPPVRLGGMMAQSELIPGAINAALYVNDRFSQVYGNALEQPEVTGLRLKMEAIPERRTAVLESARLSRTEAHAGDTIEVEATLHPYQAEARVVRVKVKLPDELDARDDAGGGERWRDSGPADDAGPGAQQQVGLAGYGGGDEPDACERPGVCDAAGPSAQAVLEGEALPGVPLSMANVLEPLKDGAEDAVDGRERGGGGIDRDGICGERIAGVEPSGEVERIHLVSIHKY